MDALQRGALEGNNYNNMNKVHLRFAFCLLVLSLPFEVMTAQEYFHIIQKGETIKSIAKKYQVTEYDLLTVNPDLNTRFYVGMQIAIPGKANIRHKSPQNNETPTNPIEYGFQQPQNYGHSRENHNANGWIQGLDYHLLLDPDAKTYGLRMSAEQNNWLHLATGLNMTFVEHGGGDFYFGVGLGRKYSAGGLLIFANAYPYAGFSIQDKRDGDKWTSDTEFKFSYGAMGTVGIGLKLYENAKGNQYYISGGYTINAFEFKTDNLLKRGVWLVGITVVD